MLSISQARKIILNNTGKTPVVMTDLMAAVGACLAKDIYSPLPIPLFDNSAMDGYAVRAADLKGASQKNPIRLKIIEEIPAGHIPRKRVKRGEASLIMTGAMFPAGADTVVVVEATKREGKLVQIFNSDDECYGGSGVTNEAKIKIDKEEYHGRAFSASLVLPPLTVIVFKIS